MDDYLKLKLEKLSDKKKEDVLKYLLDASEDSREVKKRQYGLELMSEYTDEAEKIAASWGQMQGLSSGFRKLDDLTRGFVGGEVTVVAARTSVGKTALAINIANNVALQNIPVLFVTLEMTKAQLTSRFMFINGGKTENYLKASAFVSFQQTDELDWKSVDGLIGNYCKEFSNGFVVIDHLHYFTRELENVAEDLGRITKELKKNASRWNVPILLISHVRKGNGMVTIDDLRGSSYVAQDADIVLVCGRSEDGKQMGIRVEKNRNRGIDYNNSEISLYYDRTKITETEPLPFS